MALKKRSKTRKKKSHRSKRKARAVTRRKQSLPTPRKKFSGYGDTFFTEREQEACDVMLKTNSVKATCEMMGITRPRFYQLIRSYTRKWKMGFTTHNKAMGTYTKAKSQKNLLARLLTEVKRVSVIEGVGLPQQVETTTEPMATGEQTA